MSEQQDDNRIAEYAALVERIRAHLKWLDPQQAVDRIARELKDMDAPKTKGRK